MAHVLDDHLQHRTASVLAELRKAALMVDELWRDALESGVSETEIPMGEASQAVHRAVIMLSSQRAAESTAQTFAVEWQ
jgi:hypothetical protein